MVGITEAMQLATLLKTAGDMTKAMVDLRDAEAVRSKVIDLQGVILSAQGSAMSAQADQFALIDQIRDLKDKIAQLEGWGREKERYQLTDVNVGRGSVYAYALKPDSQGTEPAHCICAKCYEDGKKSILQATTEVRMRLRVHLCPRCKAEYAYSYQPPQPVGRAITDYDPFARD